MENKTVYPFNPYRWKSSFYPATRHNDVTREVMTEPINDQTRKRERGTLLQMYALDVAAALCHQLNDGGILQMKVDWYISYKGQGRALSKHLAALLRHQSQDIDLGTGTMSLDKLLLNHNIGKDSPWALLSVLLNNPKNRFFIKLRSRTQYEKTNGLIFNHDLWEKLPMVLIGCNTGHSTGLGIA